MTILLLHGHFFATSAIHFEGFRGVLPETFKCYGHGKSRLCYARSKNKTKGEGEGEGGEIAEDWQLDSHFHDFRSHYSIINTPLLLRGNQIYFMGRMARYRLLGFIIIAKEQ